MVVDPESDLYYFWTVRTSIDTVSIELLLAQLYKTQACTHNYTTLYRRGVNSKRLWRVYWFQSTVRSDSENRLEFIEQCPSIDNELFFFQGTVALAVLYNFWVIILRATFFEMRDEVGKKR